MTSTPSPHRLVAECPRCWWSEEEPDPPPLPYADAMTTSFPAWTFDPYPLCPSCTKEHAMTILSTTIFELEHTASLLEDREEKLTALSLEVQQSRQARQQLAHLREYTQRLLTGEVTVAGPLPATVPINEEYPDAPVPPVEAPALATPVLEATPAPSTEAEVISAPPAPDPAEPAAGDIPEETPTAPTAEALASEADELFAQALGTAQEIDPQPRTIKDRVLLDIAAHPGTTGVQVIGRLGLAKNRVHPVISTIKHAGLIESTTTEVPFEYRLTQAGREAVIALAPDAPAAATTADPDSDPEDSPPVPLAEPLGPAASEAAADTVGEVQEDLEVVVAGPSLEECVQMAGTAAQLALEDGGLTEEDLRDERTDMPDPEPTEAPQLNVKAPPAPAARPRPGSSLARVLQHLETDGPATSADLAQGTGILLKDVDRCLISLRAKQLVEFKGMYSPSVHQVPGDTRPFQPSRYTRNGHQIPQDELRAALQGYKDRVRKAMVPGTDYTETELLKATDMAISHLRRALAALIDESVVRRMEGSTPATRATYALESFDLPLPGRERLNAADRRVLEHLRATTLRGGRDSVGGIADRLGLSRQDVEGTLALLHARRWLKWTRVGALALYALSPFGVDARKDAA